MASGTKATILRELGFRAKHNHIIYVLLKISESAKSWTRRSRTRKDSSGLENVDYSGEEDLDNLEREIADARTENNRRKR